MLPPDSFIEEIHFGDNDSAYSNTNTAIRSITSKRRNLTQDLEYLVTFSNDTERWIPATRLQDYQSFVQAFESLHEQTIPILEHDDTPLLDDPQMEIYEF